MASRGHNVRGDRFFGGRVGVPFYVLIDFFHGSGHRPVLGEAHRTCCNDYRGSRKNSMASTGFWAWKYHDEGEH